MNSFSLREQLNFDLLHKIYPMTLTKKGERVRLHNLAMSLDEKESVLVEYKKKKYGNGTYGRFLPNIKMNGTYMSRRARATLYSDKEYDIDLVAAHQSIAKYIVNRERGDNYFEENYPVLNRYIKERDTVIAEFQIPNEVVEYHNKIKERHDTPKDYVKTLVTILLYGGKIEEWYRDFDIQKDDIPTDVFKDFIYPIQREINDIINILINLPKYQDLITNVKKQKDKDKKSYHNGSICAIILQEEESNIITACINFVTRKLKEFRVTVYAYDGFQLRNKDNVKSDVTDAKLNIFLHELNNFVKRNFKTNALSFINKPFSPAYTEDEINDIDPTAKYLVPFFQHTNTDELKYLVSYFIQDKTIVCDDNVYYYNDCVWKLENPSFISKMYRDKVYQTVKKEVQFYFDSTDKEEKKLINQIVNSTSNTLLKHAIAESLKECINNHVKFDTQPHLLNAPNGTYNLDTHQLQSHNPNDYITKCISYPIDPNSITKESLIETRNLIRCWFDDGFVPQREVDNITDFLLQYAGKSLHGNNFIEKAVVLIGKLSRNGKSTFMGLLKNILNDYMCIVPMKHFTTYEKNKNAPSPTLVDMKGCRMFQVDEGGGEKQPIIPETFKKIVGGDSLRARSLYSNKEHVYIPQGIIWFVVNYNLTFTTEGNDTTGKLEFFDFNVKFGEEGDLGWDASKPNHKRIDYSFKHSLNDKFKQTMLHSLLYQQKQPLSERPSIYQEWNKELKSEVDTIGTWITQNIKYDPNDIYFSGDDYSVQHYDKVSKAYWKAHNKGERLVRRITLDFLYKRYKDDCGDEAVSKKNFIHSLKIAFKDIIPKGRTTLFGGKKEYIERAKYIGRDNQEEEEEEE